MSSEQKLDGIYLEKKIYCNPYELDFETIPKGHICVANERYFIINDFSVADFFVAFGIIGGLGVGAVFALLSDNVGVRYVLGLFLLACFLNLLLIKILSPPSRFIFDRMNGTLTISNMYFKKMCKKRQLSKPFSEVLFQTKYSYDRGGAISFLSIVTSKRASVDVALGYNTYKCLSFCVWYMDKNRPLPPGSMFNFYREKDYERRKAEGFPKPLYPSDIDTPEWDVLEDEEKLKNHRQYAQWLKNSKYASKNKLGKK